MDTDSYDLLHAQLDSLEQAMPVDPAIANDSGYEYVATLLREAKRVQAEAKDERDTATAIWKNHIVEASEPWNALMAQTEDRIVTLKTSMVRYQRAQEDAGAPKPKAPGTSSSERWTARVDDAEAFWASARSEWVPYNHYLSINTSALNTWAQKTKGKETLAGITLTNHTIISATKND